MPRKASPISNVHFGERLAELRKAARLSQRALAKISGVSPRMIAYYESRGALAPGHILAAFAEALGVSVDELVGTKKPKPAGKKAAASRPISAGKRCQFVS